MNPNILGTFLPLLLLASLAALICVCVCGVERVSQRRRRDLFDGCTVCTCGRVYNHNKIAIISCIVRAYVSANLSCKQSREE